MITVENYTKTKEISDVVKACNYIFTSGSIIMTYVFKCKSVDFCAYMSI
jgi:hypothetical protein